MRCPKCKVTNSGIANYCQNCGAALVKSKKRSFSPGWLFLTGIVAALLGISFFLMDMPTDRHAASNNRMTQNQPVAAPKEPIILPSRQTGATKKTNKQVLTPGVLHIEDIAGNRINQVSAVVLSNGWVALPRRMAYGAYRILFHHSDGTALAIEDLYADENDPIMLLQLPQGRKQPGIELSPWQPSDALAWQILDTAGSPFQVMVDNARYHRHSVQLPASGRFDRPGLFWQQDRLVGLSFGKSELAPFLWAGPSMDTLRPNLTLTAFYEDTFADGREEKFLLALSVHAPDKTDLLIELADGWLLQPRLEPEQTPSFLLPDAIINRMRLLLADLVRQDMAGDVLPYLDQQVISATSSVPLLIAVVQAYAANYSAAEAVGFLEAVKPDLAGLAADDLEQLDIFHRRIYIKWIDRLIKEDQIENGWEVLSSAQDRFAQDPYLILAGVRLALKQQDWEDAEQRLQSGRFPADLSSQVAELENQIAAQKSQEGKIVIRFTPGSSTIPVTALLNDSFDQRFIVDTGASMTTITTEAAEAIGIELSADTPRRKMLTVGGIVSAYAVTLDSIQIQDWMVYNLEVLVVDIPRQSGLGLLGLNFIRRFEMDLNNQEGVLILAPR